MRCVPCHWLLGTSPSQASPGAAGELFCFQCTSWCCLAFSSLGSPSFPSLWNFSVCPHYLLSRALSPQPTLLCRRATLTQRVTRFSPCVFSRLPSPPSLASILILQSSTLLSGSSGHLLQESGARSSSSETLPSKDVLTSVFGDSGTAPSPICLHHSSKSSFKPVEFHLSEPPTAYMRNTQAVASFCCYRLLVCLAGLFLR